MFISAIFCQQGESIPVDLKGSRQQSCPVAEISAAYEKSEHIVKLETVYLSVLNKRQIKSFLDAIYSGANRKKIPEQNGPEYKYRLYSASFVEYIFFRVAEFFGEKAGKF